MSRGLGKTQRLVLDALGSHQRHADIYHRYLSACEIAHFGTCGGALRLNGASFGARRESWHCKKCGGPHEIDIAETESLRRAIRTLSKAGLVESLRYPVLRARLPLTARENERESNESIEIQHHATALVKFANSVRRRR
jgi:hypothetical protein